MTIEQRVSRIEKSNRRLRIACAALALAFLGTFIVAAERDRSTVQDVVRAKSIEVIGKNGTVVGQMWATTDGSGALALSSTPGHPYFTVWSLGDDLAALDLHGPENQKVANHKTGTVYLSASDKNGANVQVVRGNNAKSAVVLSAEEAGGQVEIKSKTGSHEWPKAP